MRLPTAAPNSSALDQPSPAAPAVASAPPVWTHELPLSDAPNGYVLSLDQSLFWVLFSKLMLIPTLATVVGIAIYSSMNAAKHAADVHVVHAYERANVLQRSVESVGALSALLVLPCILGLIGSLFWMTIRDPRSSSMWKPASRQVLRLGLVAMVPMILFQFIAAIATFVAPPQGTTGPTPVEQLVTKGTSVGPSPSIMLTLVPLALAAMVFVAAIGFLVTLVSTMSYARVLAARLGDDDLRVACGRNTMLVPGLYLLILPASFIAQASLSTSPTLALVILLGALLGPVVAFTLECLVFWRIKQGIDQILVRRSTPSAMTPIPLRHAA